MIKFEPGRATSTEPFSIGKTFRSVVRSVILTERPASPVIIMMTGPSRATETFGHALKDPQRSSLRVDNEAVAEASVQLDD